MEGLKELVAAAFARHGIVCPADDLRPTTGRTSLGQTSLGQTSLGQTSPTQTIQAAEPALPGTLPEHNFRKSLQGDPAP
jgi:hypothetical protein